MRWSDGVRQIAPFPLLCMLCGPAGGQDVQLLDCGEVRFFGPACVVVLPQPPPPPPVPETPPLFAPETMAPDTPPLLLQLLEEPTVENAQAFVDWQQRRYERIMDVQHMLQRLTRQRRDPSP